MGTVASFTVYADGLAEEEAEAAIDAAFGVLVEADRTFSTWDAQSPISRLRRHELSFSELSEDILEVVDACTEARSVSRGWFDPWRLPGGFDPTGLVKGWATERAAGVLQARGVAAAMVNTGGDIALFGRHHPDEPWRIGIRHPWRHDAIARVMEVESAVATSGTYERGPHLIDPGTGRPADAAASATVTGPSLTLADALATAVAIGGEDALAAVRAIDGYEAYVIRPDGSEVLTADPGAMEYLPMMAGSPDASATTPASVSAQ